MASRRISSQCASIRLVSIRPPTKGSRAGHGGRTERVKTPIPVVRDPGSEAKTERLAESKDMLVDAATVRVVGADVEIGIVVEQAVEDMAASPGGRGDHLNVERRNRSDMWV